MSLIDYIAQIGEIPEGEYAELQGSGKYSRSETGGYEGSRIFLVNRSEELDVVPQIGEAFAEDMDFFRCVRQEVEPLAGTGRDDVAMERYSKVTCIYSNAPSPDAPVITVRAAAKSLTMPSGVYWAGTSVLTGFSIAKTFPEAEITIEITENAEPGWGVYQIQGTLNSGLWRTCTIGCVQFMCAESRSSISDSGAFKFRNAYIFHVLPQDHNLIWKADTREWKATEPLMFEYNAWGALPAAVK
jgi:hypothetical protein